MCTLSPTVADVHCTLRFLATLHCRMPTDASLIELPEWQAGQFAAMAPQAAKRYRPPDAALVGAAFAERLVPAHASAPLGAPTRAEPAMHPQADDVARAKARAACETVPKRRKGPGKSPKRRAAEAALAGRTEVALEASCSSQPATKRARTEPRALAVPACGADCCCASFDACAPWCSFAVALPDTDWQGVLAAAADVAAATGTAGRASFSLGRGVEVHLVESEAQVAPALHALRASMQDEVVAIDLEWRPEHTAGRSRRVALMQLASASVAVLVRTHRMRRLPPALEAFLRDPGHLILGFSWDSCDERKLQASFGLGRGAMRFLDLQSVAAMLGWHGLGLAGLARRVLGVAPAKARAVAMSDWEAPRLSGRQLTYAALDALLAGGVLRALRLWHAAPCECAGCPLPLGAPAPPRLACRGCGKRFSGVAGLLSHAGATAHPAAMRGCEACGRLSSWDGGD